MGIFESIHSKTFPKLLKGDYMNKEETIEIFRELLEGGDGSVNGYSIAETLSDDALHVTRLILDLREEYDDLLRDLEAQHRDQVRRAFDQMNTLQFNTGNPYTTHGQRIFAKIVGHHEDLIIVAMVDRDRSIAEYVLVDEFAREEIMEEYRYSRFYFPPEDGDLPLFVDSRDYESEFAEV